MAKASKGPDGLWSHAQVREFVKLMRRDLADGWRFMTDEVREAFVAQSAFSVARARHAGTVDVNDMDWLLTEMRIEAGLIRREDFE